MTASGFLNPGKARSPQKGVGHQSLVYANAPITPQGEWPAPEPLRQVVEACMQELPEAGPTGGELRRWWRRSTDDAAPLPDLDDFVERSAAESGISLLSSGLGYGRREMARWLEQRGQMTTGAGRRSMAASFDAANVTCLYPFL
jgi:hypothetical protein